MAAALRLIIVTPERTVLDESVISLRMPLIDGDLGVLPGRLPLVGRLGTGELHLRGTAQGDRNFFVDGGFVQVRDNTITILTSRAFAPSSLSLTDCEAQLSTAMSLTANNERESEYRLAEQLRARKALAVARGQRP